MGKIFEALEKSEQSAQNGSEKPEKLNFSDLESNIDHQSKISSSKNNHGSVDAGDPLPIGINEALVTLLKPHSAASEQFRQLKTNILFPEKGEPPRTIMITSPSPHEGKSFVSANLAISIAQSIDEFVLLMDCDLRDPSIQSLFGIKGAKGLSEYLSSAMPLSSVLKKTFINKLTILPAGSIPANPSELLASEQMRRMLHEVKLRYNDRYILIDTPPPYITSETNAIARYVDGIILVVKQGKTRTKEVQDIIDIYGRDKILGVIQNFSKKKVGYGYGYHKYGYGNK
ncbi:MAG: polysaccharide biosynthesis tyrosine autokinase [Desulfobacula sp.]|nr:polysaccharide biosynthesis tyrosine autokinase [Desulfobacula sp.]